MLHEQKYLLDILYTKGLKEFAYQYAKLMTMRKQFEYITPLKSLMHGRRDILSYSVLKYAVWTMSFQKDVLRNFVNAVKGNNPVGNVKEIMSKMILGEMVKLAVSLMVGNLKEEDEDWGEAILKSLLGFFNPRDWRGSWNMATLTFPNPTLVYQIMTGQTVYLEDLYSHSLGYPVFLLTQMFLAIANTGSWVMAKMRGNKKQEEKAERRIRQHIHSFSKSTMYLYSLLAGIITSVTGSENFNVMRLSDKTYSPKEAKRMFYSSFIYPITQAHFPTLKKSNRGGKKLLTPQQRIKQLNQRRFK